MPLKEISELYDLQVRSDQTNWPLVCEGPHGKIVVSCAPSPLGSPLISANGTFHGLPFAYSPIATSNLTRVVRCAALLCGDRRFDKHINIEDYRFALLFAPDNLKDKLLENLFEIINDRLLNIDDRLKFSFLSGDNSSRFCFYSKAQQNGYTVLAHVDASRPTIHKVEIIDKENYVTYKEFYPVEHYHSFSKFVDMLLSKMGSFDRLALAEPLAVMR